VLVQATIGTVPWNLYSLPGMAVTEAVALSPIAYVFCANALRQADASLESAAQVCGASPLRILFTVNIPMLRPPMVYSSILVFSMSAETLSIPLLYGQPVRIEVFSTFLYTNGLQSINPDYGVLGAASTLILVVTVGLVALQAKLLKDAQRFVSVRGKATRPRRLDLGWVQWVGVAFITFYIVFGALLPIGGLIFRSFTRIFTPLQSPFRSITGANPPPVPHRARYRAVRAQHLRLPARQPRGDDARVLRQRAAAQPARPRRRGRSHPRLHRRSGEVDLRRSDVLPRGRGAAAGDRGQRVRHRVVTRLGRQGPRAAGCTRGSRRVVRADPPLEPHRHGHRALQFLDGQGAATLGLTGHEVFSIDGLSAGTDGPFPPTVTVHADGLTFEVTPRLDTAREQDYIRHGGIMKYVLRSMLG